MTVVGICFCNSTVADLITYVPAGLIASTDLFGTFDRDNTIVDVFLGRKSCFGGRRKRERVGVGKDTGGTEIFLVLQAQIELLPS